MRAFKLACGLAVGLAAAVSWAGVYQGGSAAPTPETAESAEQETFNYYEVEASSLEELRHEVYTRGPHDRTSNQRFAGWTSWQIRWWIDHHVTDAGCHVSKAITQTHVTYTLPHWANASHASLDLQQSWHRFVTALKEHEFGHGRLARELGGRIQLAIENLPPQPTCQTLNREASLLANRMIWEDKEQEAYDRRTGHGEKQGAAFPRILVRAD
jgi:predicted secreted Zn-dependent protease